MILTHLYPSIVSTLAAMNLLNSPTETINIPENFSPDRPPILNETVCGCRCGRAGCMCYNAGEGSSITSTPDRDGGQDLRFDDLAARVHELGLGGTEPQQVISSTPSSHLCSTSDQTYCIDSNDDFNGEVDIEATIMQFLHDHRQNRNDQGFLDDYYNFRPYPWTLGDFTETLFFRSQSPGDSLMVNPSTGEHSMMSSMTSSAQLSVPMVNHGCLIAGTGDWFHTHENHFIARPLELTEPLQHQHHYGHGLIRAASPLARQMVIESGVSECNDGYDEN